MGNEIKAIPTTYNGVEYRSRMEADMALLLNRLSIPFQYEPKSFLIDTKGIHYRPDFALFGDAAFIEVRGYERHEGDDQIRAFSSAVFAGQYGTMTYAAVHVDGWQSTFVQHWQYAPSQPHMHRDSVQDMTWWFRKCGKCKRWGPGIFSRRSSRCVACHETLDADSGNALGIDIHGGYLVTDVAVDGLPGNLGLVRVRDVSQWEGEVG